MKRYRTTHLIRSEHLNHHGNLYAGRGIEWMIECGFITASTEFGSNHILYKDTHKFNFSKPVQPGSIMYYEGTVVRAGRSSLTIRVGMYNQATGEQHAEGIATFIAVDEPSLVPIAHGVVLDETDDAEELEWRKQAETYFAK